MPAYDQSVDEFNELLEGRTLRFILTASESKSGRPLSAAFQDVESGDLISVMAMFGALRAAIVAEGHAQYVPSAARSAE